MGGGSKKQTVGYRYFIGAHFVLGLGAADKLLSIHVDDKLAWFGGNSGGRVKINEPNLFGGTKREGGIVGDVDFLSGDPGQGQNDYLQKVIGDDVPAYRRFMSLVLRQVEIGMNPYLKPWRFRLQRVYAQPDGSSQWYASRAAINLERAGSIAVYFAVDVSGSMDTDGRIVTLKAAIGSALEELRKSVQSGARVDVGIGAFNNTLSEISRLNATEADIDALIAWVQALSADGGTNFNVAGSGAQSWFEATAATEFDKRSFFLVTDGVPGVITDTSLYSNMLDRSTGTLSEASNSAVDCYGVNINLSDTSETVKLDNTPDDGVAIVNSNDTAALSRILSLAVGANPDMNPAHIIYEALTSKAWGLGTDPSFIGSSFQTAADVFFNEGLGLSMKYESDDSVEEFIADVLAHCDASLYVDRRTGLWELKPIRNDYDVANLLRIDASSVTRVAANERRDPADATNTVTVQYYNRARAATSAVTVHDGALIQEVGVQRSKKFKFFGFNHESLAARAALRELNTLSAALANATIECTRAADPLNPGDAFILHFPEYGFEEEVCRVITIEESPKNEHGLTVKFASDVFNTEIEGVVDNESEEEIDDSNAPAPLPNSLIDEVSYWQLVQEQGHATADLLLGEDPGIGYLNALAGAPGGIAFGAVVSVDDGTGYDDQGSIEFDPTAILVNDLSDNPTDTTIAITDPIELDEVSIGSLAQIGGELVRVDSINEARTEITVGRGCLDTLPQVHAAGTAIFFWGDTPAAIDTQFVAGESLNVQLLTVTTEGTLTLGIAPIQSLNLDSRAIRPLPAGNVQVNGAWSVDRYHVTNGGTLALTWAHRSRVDQTGETLDDFTAGDIGPEPGVSYEVQIAYEDVLTGEVDYIANTIAVPSATSYTVTATDFPAPTGTQNTARVSVRSLRGGYTDRNAREYRVHIPSAGGYGGPWGTSWGV